jgi:hypothetical protein
MLTVPSSYVSIATLPFRTLSVDKGGVSRIEVHVVWISTEGVKPSRQIGHESNVVAFEESCGRWRLVAVPATPAWPLCCNSNIIYFSQRFIYLFLRRFIINWLALPGRFCIQPRALSGSEASIDCPSHVHLSLPFRPSHVSVRQ